MDTSKEKRIQDATQGSFFDRETLSEVLGMLRDMELPDNFDEVVERAAVESYMIAFGIDTREELIARMGEQQRLLADIVKRELGDDWREALVSPEGEAE